jgi:hypothetical protein
MQLARQILLKEPLLNEHPKAFAGEVEEAIKAKYLRA